MTWSHFWDAKGQVLSWSKFKAIPVSIRSSKFNSDGVISNFFFSCDLKLALKLPTTLSSFCLFIKIFLCANTYLCERRDCFTPSLPNFWGNGISKHLTDCCHQILVYNRVHFWLNRQGAVSVCNLLYEWSKHAQVINMRGVRNDSISKGALLASLMLVALVKERQYLRVILKHCLVETFRDRVGVFRHDRGRRLDDFDGLFSKRHLAPNAMFMT
mmetsp:Transcript_6952/g.11013  ORF Transcript_6952/g.11013 Transcript_6952/m.11013 type:complete len:214 (-) Transcript_6952:41-682(-)